MCTSGELASVRSVWFERRLSFFEHTVLGQNRPVGQARGEPMGMLAGAAIVFFAYIGFDSVSTHAEEARNPARDVPYRDHDFVFGPLHRPLYCRGSRAHRDGALQSDQY